jgi:pantoate--beta-alanine ligase
MRSQPQTPTVLRSENELKAWRSRALLETAFQKKIDSSQLNLGFVPTMGALHEGHLELVRQSKSQCDLTVVSIFVNPLQFAPQEDLGKYPRTWDQDLALLTQAGVDAVFYPDSDLYYPKDRSTRVLEESVSIPLCGQFRPGHFEGVATVVLKLFQQVQPHLAFFGTKDAQQVRVIERMVRDLSVPITIARVETIRESDGLALSSRNRYLSAEERGLAPEIYRALQASQMAWTQGERDPRAIEKIARQHLERFSDFKIQYLEVRDSESLADLHSPIRERSALIAVAAYLGTTRLIDNLELRA